jgi:hypothetical protein
MPTELIDFKSGVVAVNPTTHKLQVETATDVDIGDVSVLNAAGVKINPATEESLAAVAARLLNGGDSAASLLSQILECLNIGSQGNISSIMGTLLDSQDYVVSAAATVAVGATSVLPTAFGVTLPTNLVRIVLLPAGTGVYVQVGGAASANTILVPTGGLSLPVTKAVADTIQIFAATVRCSLLVCIPR